MNSEIFRGCIPALMTPCLPDRSPDYDTLVRKAKSLTEAGMNAVVYCGSMGDWPLLTDAQRHEGVKQLVEAGVRVVVGTGAQNSHLAAAHAAHAQSVGAGGLMLIPRVLSRGTSAAAQRNHFSQCLAAAPGLPAVIYNSPYYGFETRAELFFDLQREHSNLVGFKEFGGAAALSYAGEHITHASEDLVLMAGVDTQVFHGFVHCGARGAITGIGNCLPQPVLKLIQLCELAVNGDAEARSHAKALDEALCVLSTFDEGPDLVLYYKYLLVLQGESEFERHFLPTDVLSPSQKRYAETQWNQFQRWWQSWPGKSYGES